MFGLIKKVVSEIPTNQAVNESQLPININTRKQTGSNKKVISQERYNELPIRKAFSSVQAIVSLASEHKENPDHLVQQLQTTIPSISVTNNIQLLKSVEMTEEEIAFHKQQQAQAAAFAAEAAAREAAAQQQRNAFDLIKNFLNDQTNQDLKKPSYDQVLQDQLAKMDLNSFEEYLLSLLNTAYGVNQVGIAAQGNSNANFRSSGAASVMNSQSLPTGSMGIMSPVMSSSGPLGIPENGLFTGSQLGLGVQTNINDQSIGDHAQFESLVRPFKPRLGLQNKYSNASFTTNYTAWQQKQNQINKNGISDKNSDSYYRKGNRRNMNEQKFSTTVPPTRFNSGYGNMFQSGEVITESNLLRSQNLDDSRGVASSANLATFPQHSENQQQLQPRSPPQNSSLSNQTGARASTTSKSNNRRRIHTATFRSNQEMRMRMNAKLLRVHPNSKADDKDDFDKGSILRMD